MRRILLALFLCASLLGSAALAEGNLLVNGGFEQTTGGFPDGWTADMWRNDPGVTYLETRPDERDGGQCAMIENVASNDARYVQEVQVTPGATYRFSGWIKAEGISTDAAGASLSVIGAYESFPELHDTQGAWEYLEYYLIPDEGQYALTVGPRLGDYSADNSGKAYFDDLALEKVDEAPAGYLPIELTNFELLENQAPGELIMPEEQKGVTGQIIGMLAAFVAVLLALWILRARGTLPNTRLLLLAVLLVAAIVRLYLMATNAGYPNDMACFFGWSQSMARVGPAEFYHLDQFCDYPPGYMYILWITGGILNLLGVTQLDALGRIIVKLGPLVADLASVYLIWRLAKKRLGETPALLLSALYALSPAILVNGAMWGQIDSVTALGLLCTVALALSGKWTAALPVYTITVLMKPQALLAGPVGLVALVLDMLPWKAGGKEVAKRAGKGLLASVAVAAAMLLPFLWKQERPIAWLIELYTGTMGSYAIATLSAPNLYYLLGGNWVPLETMVGPLSIGTWGAILMVIVVIGVMALFLKHRDRELLPFFCALMFIGLYLFGVMMHERYLFPALLLLLYAYIRRPDWRVLLLFCGYSVTFFVNCAYVLAHEHMPLGVNLFGGLLSACNLLLFGVALWVALKPAPRPLKAPTPQPADSSRWLAALEGRSPRMAGMRAKDWALMLGITAVYAVIAFVGLGSTVAPQTAWTSTGVGESVTFDLGEEREFQVMYYPGINHRDQMFTLAFSDDGESWYGERPFQAAQGECFRWKFASEANYTQDGQVSSWNENNPLVFIGRYVRLTAEEPAMTLMEVTFKDLGGNALPVAAATGEGGREENGSDPWLLADEPETAPAYPSYYNGTYFDEIYHARTGYEHANQLMTYEWTHPPLGKVFMMLAIKLFGMTPFGWRFAGTLTGVLMVPAMYLLGKLLFRKSRYAFLAAFVMAFDMMHLTQTRIATIDSFAVLFILLMYLCMFRYMQMSFFRDGWRTLLPLGLSGLFMGLGCASKWICMYAGVGLAVLFAWSMVQRFFEWRSAMAMGDAYAERVKGYGRYLVGTLLACVGFFIVIPLAIYYFSYIPQFAWEGGLTWQRFWDTQVSMFSYHANLVDSHGFQSPWYEWPLMLKPMYYFNGRAFMPEGIISTIMCMGNPAVWWVGFAAFLYVVYRWLKPHLRGREQTDHRPALLLISFAAQFLPWVIVPRSMFIYHYFGSLPFVMLSIVFAFEQLFQRRERLARRLMIAYMALVVVLFIGFYPIATGVPVPEQWANAMNWLGFLKLPGWAYKGWIFY